MKRVKCLPLWFGVPSSLRGPDSEPYEPSRTSYFDPSQAYPPVRRETTTVPGVGRDGGVRYLLLYPAGVGTRQEVRGHVPDVASEVPLEGWDTTRGASGRRRSPRGGGEWGPRGRSGVSGSRRSRVGSVFGPESKGYTFHICQ